MSLLDELNSTTITEEWLLRNLWTPVTDYSGDHIGVWYTTNLNIMICNPLFNLYPKIYVRYNPGTCILNLWDKYITVTTVEDLDFTISQLCKQERAKYLKPKWMN